MTSHVGCGKVPGSSGAVPRSRVRFRELGRCDTKRSRCWGCHRSEPFFVAFPFAFPFSSRSTPLGSGRRPLIEKTETGRLSLTTRVRHAKQRDRRAHTRHKHTRTSTICCFFVPNRGGEGLKSQRQKMMRRAT